MTVATRHKETTERKAFLKQVLPALTDKEVTELEEISLLVHHEEGDLIAQEGAYASNTVLPGDFERGAPHEYLARTGVHTEPAVGPQSRPLLASHAPHVHQHRDG